MSLLKSALMGVIVMVASVGCNGRGARTIAIDEYTFRVPEEYLVKGSIPWLPASQHDGLMFVINPEAPPEGQKIVNINSVEVTCNPTASPASDMLSSACASAKGEIRSIRQPFAPEKIYPYRDVTFQWRYRVTDDDGNPLTVAECMAGDDETNGLCTTMSNYRSLVFSVGLRSSEIQEIPEIWSKVRQMLASWEVSAIPG